MYSTMSSEQEMLRDSVRRFMKSEVAPTVAQHDKDKTFPFELLKELSQFGYIGGRLPEALGGMDMDQMTWAMLMEEAGYTWLSLRTMVNITNAAINKLAAEANEEQRERFLKPLLASERKVFNAISEPSTGSNIAQVQTRADLQGDHYVLNGRKLWITNGAFGDFGIVVARTFSPDCQGGLSTFLVERDVSPYEVRNVDTMVLRSTGTAELAFDNVKVPRENLLGEEGNALKKMLMGLDGGCRGHRRPDPRAVCRAHAAVPCRSASRLRCAGQPGGHHRRRAERCCADRKIAERSGGGPQPGLRDRSDRAGLW